MSRARYAGYLSWPGTRRAAAALKAARGASGMRQRDVAQSLGWSTAKVSHALTATTRMTTGDALALARVLGADPAELGTGEAEA